MKNVLLISLTALVILFSSGCKKKKETTTTPTDPCANTVCLNGGTCVDGSCSCPTGYMGADCGTQKTPVKITISAIKVTKFPALNGSSTWDAVIEQNPDIFAKLVKAGTTTALATTGRIDNAAPGTSYTLPGFISLDITDLTSQYNLELVDFDTTSGNDAMGNIDFSIYSATNRFPTTITVDNGALTFELTVSYTY